MKIEIEKLDIVEAYVTIHFKDAIVECENQKSPHLTPMGTKALRILSLYMGPVPFSTSEKHPRQVSFHRKYAGSKFETVKALQAIMNKHAKKHLRVAGFQTISVKDDRFKPLKTVTDIENLWNNEPRAIILVSRRIRLSLPTQSADKQRIEKALEGQRYMSFMISRVDNENGLGIDELELVLYYNINDRGIDPWAMMKNLESRITKAIQD